jgi:hypothetical protein
MAAAVKITRLDYTASELHGLAAKNNHGAQVLRLLALAFVLDGQPRHEAAQRAGMDRQILRDWVHRYNAEGLSGLKSIRRSGRKALMPMCGRQSVNDPRWCGTTIMIPSISLAPSTPDRGVGAAIIMPAVNTEAMNEHLKEIDTQVSDGAHAVLILDGAGWHQTGGQLQVTDNITLLHLPPYAPELNPVENVWEYLRANKLCGRVWHRSVAKQTFTGRPTEGAPARTDGGTPVTAKRTIHPLDKHESLLRSVGITSLPRPLSDRPGSGQW